MSARSGAECIRWRPELVDVARGVVDESAGLRAHLDGCPTCAEELRELTAVATVVARADPTAPPDTESQPPLALGNRVVAAVRARRRRRLATVALGAAAAVLVVAGAATTAMLATRPSSEPPAVASPVQLSVTETAVPWGTRLQLDAAGLPADGPFRVWVEDETGARTPVGSFGPTDNGRASVPASTELSPGGIRRVGLSTTDGDELAVVDTG